MESTHTCPYCDMPAAKLSRCSGCKKAVYCSKECQKEHWPSHIFDCQPGRPINTAYRLYRAALRDVFPEDPETRRDYGFEKAARILGGNAESELLGLYRGLLIFQHVPPKDVHKWRLQGRLGELVQATYEKIPPENRGGYYLWFLQHQSLLQNDVPDDELVQEYVSRSIRAAWVKTGGPPGDSLNVIQNKIMLLSPARKACHILYRGLVNSVHPHPIQDEWVSFGFVSTVAEKEEHVLGVAYLALASACSFEEFCTAHERAGMPALFERYGLQCSPFFRDVMAQGPSVRKSVWDLKQYAADAPAAGARVELIRPVWADYGYMFAQDEAESQLLDGVYRRYFTHARANPPDLHQACVQGRLFAYLQDFGLWTPAGREAELLRDRLLRNMYPLSFLEDAEEPTEDDSGEPGAGIDGGGEREADMDDGEPDESEAGVDTPPSSSSANVSAVRGNFVPPTRSEEPSRHSLPEQETPTPGPRSMYSYAATAALGLASIFRGWT
ncbi:hypothetical protein BD413DRAFT_535572 [Trametes elegans]|nr:hypothetical protein BD413DRAFT_535572 [Trametes elegans]